MLAVLNPANKPAYNRTPQMAWQQGVLGLIHPSEDLRGDLGLPSATKGRSSDVRFGLKLPFATLDKSS